MIRSTLRIIHITAILRQIIVRVPAIGDPTTKLLWGSGPGDPTGLTPMNVTAAKLEQRKMLKTCSIIP